MLLLFSQQIETNPNNATWTEKKPTNTYSRNRRHRYRRRYSSLSLLHPSTFSALICLNKNKYQLPYRHSRLYNRTAHLYIVYYIHTQTPTLTFNSTNNVVICTYCILIKQRNATQREGERERVQRKHDQIQSKYFLFTQ